jgi:hypothetical protein
MKRLALAAAVTAAFSTGAWCQAPPPGTYQFISGPGVGTPPFTVSGFSTSLGGSVSSAHLPFCSGLHVHGTFNGFADPAGGGCGHGIIALIAAPPVSGGGLPGGAPTNVAGQLALTAPAPGVRVDADIIRSAALSGFALPSQGIAAVLEMFQGRSTGDGQFVTFVGGEAGTTIMDLGRPAGIGGPAGAAPAAGSVVRTALENPALRVLSAPAATSWLEDLAAYNDQDAEGYRREADRSRQQADQWRELADDARRQAERNRQRADDARRDGREKDAQDWEKEAQRDEQRAGERDDEAKRLDGWSDEQQRREQQSRDLADQRRADAERAREQARQAERDRAERVRREAEEKARMAREEREARRAKEAAEREARRQAAEDKERARQREIARQREAREREHRAQLDAEQRARDQRARGSSSDADLAKAAADRKKKEQEEQASLLDRFADLVIAVLDGKSETPEEKLLQAAKEKLQEKLEEKLKEEALKRTGMDKVKEQLEQQLADKLDDLGLDAAAGKLGEGVETLKKIKEIGDWMNAELDKNAGRQRRQVSKVDMLSDPNSRPERLRGASSGTIAGRDVLDVYKGAVEILKP